MLFIIAVIVIVIVIIVVIVVGFGFSAGWVVGQPVVIVPVRLGPDCVGFTLVTIQDVTNKQTKQYFIFFRLRTNNTSTIVVSLVHIFNFGSRA